MGAGGDVDECMMVAGWFEVGSVKVVVDCVCLLSAVAVAAVAVAADLQDLRGLRLLEFLCSLAPRFVLQ